MRLSSILIAAGTLWSITAIKSASAQCTETWLGQGIPAPDDHPDALAFWDPDGDGPQPELIVASFSTTNNSLVLTFDGTRWRRLGNEFIGSIYALTVFDGALVAAGSFSANGDVALGEVARWNGSQWEPMGYFDTTYDSSVRSLCQFQGELIAGGYFPDRIARWDGAQWQRVGDATLPAVREVAATDDSIFVSTTSRTVYQWDGASWHQLGPTFNASINALTTFNGRAVAGGPFTSPGGHVVQWNGTAWEQMGFNLLSGAIVYDLIVVSDQLIAGGLFATSTLPPPQPPQAKNVARLVGTKWVKLGAMSPDGSIGYLAVSGGRMIGSGIFDSFSGIPTDIGLWDGTSWSFPPVIPRGVPLDGYPHAFEEFQGNLYAGGEHIKSAGAVAGNNFAYWDGDVWHSTDVEFDIDPNYLAVNALQAFGDDLIVGGRFTRANDIVTNYIGRWDGAQWHAMSTGTSSNVEALTVFQNELIAGGSFTSAGGTAVGRIARWDGNSWRPCGPGLDNGGVGAMTVYHDELVVAGGFTSVAGLPAHNIATWDGLVWRTPFGDGFDGSVSSLTVYNDELVAAGFFTQADGTPASRIARWDGAHWLPLGDGVILVSQYDRIDHVTVHHGELIAAGEFSQIGTVTTRNIARWNGVEWRDLDGGDQTDPQYYATALGHFRDDLVLGGVIERVGNIASVGWARWGYPCCRGDYNADGTINLSDLGVLLTDYGCTGGNCPGDTDGDRDTDLSDLGVVLSVYGTHWQ